MDAFDCAGLFFCFLTSFEDLIAYVPYGRAVADKRSVLDKIIENLHFHYLLFIFIPVKILYLGV